MYVSRLHPFWWLSPVVTCDVVKGCLEGDYSSYAIYDSFDDSEVIRATTNGAWVNILETKAFLVSVITEGYIRIYDIATKTAGPYFVSSTRDIQEAHPLGWFFKQSMLNTYVCFMETTTNNLRIYKNGVLLQTLTPTDLGLTAIGAYSISFSPRGTYIFVTGTRLASGNLGWVVLVGV